MTARRRRADAAASARGRRRHVRGSPSGPHSLAGVQDARLLDDGRPRRVGRPAECVARPPNETISLSLCIYNDDDGSTGGPCRGDVRIVETSKTNGFKCRVRCRRSPGPSRAFGDVVCALVVGNIDLSSAKTYRSRRPGRRSRTRMTLHWTRTIMHNRCSGISQVTVLLYRTCRGYGVTYCCAYGSTV